MIPIPINDHIRRRTFWYATLFLIAINTLIFIYELSLGRGLNRLVFYFGIIPARYTSPHGVGLAEPLVFFVPIIASMFLHGGWLHLIGNMLFLFVFGRSIEDRYGHANFFLMYFLSGFIAAGTYIAMNMASTVPTIGASGAIAGILGAYLVSFPGAKITTIIPLFIIFWTIRLPAILVLGYWFLIQFVAGFQVLNIESASAGGVAWWAHIGGFVAGMVFALIFPKQRKRMVEAY